MTNETCPHCGAERRYEERYDCGTWLASADFPASQCYQRQLAAVTAERCREAGASPVRKGQDVLHVMPGCVAWDDGGPHMSCELTNATRGQLRLALMMENDDTDKSP